MGLTAPEVASISGHRTVSMLFRYAHADIGAKTNTVNWQQCQFKSASAHQHAFSASQ